MSEVKYKAWLKEERFMVDVEGIDFKEKVIYHENLQVDCITDTEPKSITDPITYHKFDDCELLQYVGLKDKNGKDIYEGYILDGQEGYAIIEFRKGSFCAVWYGCAGGMTENGYDEDYGGFGEMECETFQEIYADKCEVIGNIYENKELLGGGE